MPGQREGHVVVDYVGLHGQDGDEHGEGEEEEAQETGLVHGAAAGAEDMHEVTSVFVETDEDEAYIV